MANTVTPGRSTVHVLFDGATDFDYGSDLFVIAIEILPNAGNDLCTIRDATTTGVKIAEVKMSADTDQRYFDFSNFPQGGKIVRPCVANAEVTGSVEVIFHIKG